MSKTIKRIIIFFMVIVFTVTFAGCGSGGETESELSDFPTKEYADDKEFIFFADLPPVVNRTLLETYKQAGFNSYILIPWESYNANFSAESSEQFVNALNLLEELDMTAFVRSFIDEGADPDGRFTQFIDNGFDLSEYPAFEGFYIADEPGAGSFDVLAENHVKHYNQYYKDDAVWHLNLFPSYATSDQLGTKDTSAVNGRNAYENYVFDYAEKVLSKVEGEKYLGMDHYPLNQKGSMNYLSDTFLYDLMVTAQAAKQYGTQFHTCIQAYSNVSEGRREFTSSNDAKFLFNTAVAFGATLFEVFCYESFDIAGIGHYAAMIDAGAITDNYVYIQEAMTELKSYDHVLKSFVWEGAKGIVGSNGESSGGISVLKASGYELNQLSGINEVSATEDAVIGQFKDGEDTGFMVVNYTDPSEMKSNTVTLKFDSCDKVVVYRNGRQLKYRISGNTLQLPLIPGEGVFVIPQK